MSVDLTLFNTQPTLPGVPDQITGGVHVLVCFFQCDECVFLLFDL